MAAEDFYLCYALYFSSLRNSFWVQSFWELVLKYASELGQEVTHFVPVRYDHEGWRCKTYRHIKRNQKHLTEEGVDESLESLDFYCVGSDGDFVMAPCVISIANIQREKGYGRVFVQCQMDVLIDAHMGIDFPKRFITDINSLIEIKYGFVYLMEGKKYPYAYSEDMATSPHLTAEEEENIKLWEEEGHRFQTIVRDVYWGNVLTKSHWRNDKAKERYLLKALEHECQGNVFWIDGETLFFCAPFDVCPQDDPKMLDFRDRLCKVFDKCEIEVIRAHLDNYPEPQSEPKINLLQEDTTKKPKKLRSKKKLIIRYPMVINSETTKEHKCVFDIFQQVGPLPLTIEREETADGVRGEIMVEGSKVPKVRKATIYCIKKMNMDIEVNPPIDKEDYVADNNVL